MSRTYGPATYGDAVYGAPSGQTNSDSYGDGASSPFGGAVPIDLNLSIFATYTTAAQITPDEDDFYYARLPFERAQKVLDTGKTEPRSLRVANLGWHGNRLDQERGSFVIVNSDGPLADLVGERLRITVGRGLAVARCVTAYCHTRATLDSDLSVPRRLFLALDQLGDERPEVEVEVIV